MLTELFMQAAVLPEAAAPSTLSNPTTRLPTPGSLALRCRPRDTTWLRPRWAGCYTLPEAATTAGLATARWKRTIRRQTHGLRLPRCPRHAKTLDSRQ